MTDIDWEPYVGMDAIDRAIIEGSDYKAAGRKQVSIADLADIFYGLRRRAEEIGIMDTYISRTNYEACEQDGWCISVIDPDVPGRYKVIGVLGRDGHIVWENETPKTDAPSLGGQSTDMSPMLSKNHKRKSNAD